MRLKEDKTNWRASNIIRKITPVPEEPINHSRKSTRKWCKGKVGREHDYETIRENFSFMRGYVEKGTCSTCGKKKYSYHW